MANDRSDSLLFFYGLINSVVEGGLVSVGTGGYCFPFSDRKLSYTTGKFSLIYIVYSVNYLVC